MSDHVEITASCPYGCGAVATWFGVMVAAGGDTRYYRVVCPTPTCPTDDEAAT